MSLKTKFNNLIDLKDHCFLCYRPTEQGKCKIARVNSDESETSYCSEEGDSGGKVDGEKVSDDEQNEKKEEKEMSFSSSSENCCKSFLTSISRYLRIQYAIVNITIPGDNEPKTIRKRWENLIKGDVCKRCKPTVDHFRDLYHQITYLELQMDLVAQQIEHSINLADHENSSQAGKKMLESKWETEKGVVNPKFNFDLLTRLRDEITTKAAKKNTFPLLRLRRMLSPVRRDGHGQPEGNLDVDADEARPRSSRTMAGPRQRHRPSLNDDSGFSTTTSENGLSPVSSVSFDTMDRQFSNAITIPHNNGKECVVIRKFIRCKKCNEKVVKGKFKQHCKLNHPKPTGESCTSAADSTANPSSTENKEHRVKEKAMVCPKKKCRGVKFLRKESFLNHLGLYHRELLPTYSSDRSTAIPEVVSENNQEESDTTPSSEEVAPSSPVITTAPTINEPRANDDSTKEQGLGHNETNETNSRRRALRRPYQKRNFSCATCPNKFHNEEDLLLHAQKHRVHQCNFCNTICQNHHATALHELHSHGDFSKSEHPIPFGCPRCEEKFQNANTYKSHFWRSHLNKPSSSFKCFRCHTTFRTVEPFKDHVNLKACNSTSSSSFLKNSDTQKVSVTAEPQPGPSKRDKSDDFECNICKLKCSSAFALKSHVVSHDPDIEACSDCPRVFKDKDTLAKHRNTYHVPAPAAVPAPSGGIKIVLTWKFCKHCNSRKPYKSVKDFEKHVRKHENKSARKSVRKKKSSSRYQGKQCQVCKEFFLNLGAHMKAHVTHPSQEDEEYRENNMNDYSNTEGEFEAPSHNEDMEMDVDRDCVVINDEDDSSPIKSLADRVKLRTRRASSHATVSTDFQLEDSDDEDDYTPSQRGRKRSMSRCIKTRSRIGRSERNESKTDDENDDDDFPERKKSKPTTVEETPTTPENEEGVVENQNVDNAHNKDGVNTRQPLVNINSTLPPRIENSGKASNKDDDYELARQSSVNVNSSLPPKKRPHPPASLPPPVADVQEDTNDSSCSTVILTKDNRPRTSNSTNNQIRNSDPPAENVIVQENEIAQGEQVNLSSADVKSESSNCVPSGIAKVHNWLAKNDAASTSTETQGDDNDDEIVDETAEKVVEKKPDVEVGESLFPEKLNTRVNTFLTELIQTGKLPPTMQLPLSTQTTPLAINVAKNIPLLAVKPTPNIVRNTADDITSPPSPEVITID